MSVMDVSGSDSMGEATKPVTMLRAIHWPPPWAWGLQNEMAWGAFY